jgi:hypothetical protein
VLEHLRDFRFHAEPDPGQVDRDDLMPPLLGILGRERASAS